MRAEEFFGRDAEARTILQNTVQGHASLLVGEAGMGKSALLDYLTPAFTDVGVPLFLSRVSPFGSFLRELFTGLWEAELGEVQTGELKEDWKAFGKMYGSNDEKVVALLKQLGALRESGKKLIVVIDDAAGVTLTTRPWLERLTDVATVVAATTPDALAKKGSKRFWKRFDEVRLGPLSKSGAGELLSALVTRYRVTADEPEIYRRRVLDLAQGSPFELERLVKYHAAQELVRTKELLSYGQNFVERDEKGVVLAPVVLLLGAFAIAARYIAHAQGDTDMVILAAVGVGLMVVFRPWLQSSLKPRSR